MERERGGRGTGERIGRWLRGLGVATGAAVALVGSAGCNPFGIAGEWAMFQAGFPGSGQKSFAGLVTILPGQNVQQVRGEWQLDLGCGHPGCIVGPYGMVGSASVEADGSFHIEALLSCPRGVSGKDECGTDPAWHMSFSGVGADLDDDGRMDEVAGELDLDVDGLILPTVTTTLGHMH